IKVLHDASLSLTAGAIRSLVIGGNLSNSTLRFLTGAAPRVMALGTLAVTGAISGSVLHSDGNVSSIKAGGLHGSRLYAGVGGLAGQQQLPDAAGQFTA